MDGVPQKMLEYSSKGGVMYNSALTDLVTFGTRMPVAVGMAMLREWLNCAVCISTMGGTGMPVSRYSLGRWARANANPRRDSGA